MTDTLTQANAEETAKGLAARTEPDGIDFEPEILFPPDPFDAARIFLAAMAYPERDAGQPGGLGVPFIEALWCYPIWSASKARGKRYVREKWNNPSLDIPRKKDFDGALNRGIKRIHRRMAAYEIVGNQFVNGFFRVMQETNKLTAQGRWDEAFVKIPGKSFAPARPELWERLTPSPRQTVRSNLPRWSDCFSLNVTGNPADPTQKEKDIIRRGFVQSRPVLHMAHALNEICVEVAPKFEGWDEYDPYLVLLWNCDQWVWDAIDMANRWRMTSRFSLVRAVNPSQMIKLIPPEKMGR